MSLRRLMRDFMTIQTSEGAAKTTQGALDRQTAWISLPDFRNMRCHVQEKNRKDLITTQFAIVEQEHVDIIYHQSRLLYEYAANHAELRIITQINPRKKLIFPTDLENDENLVIYMFKGHVEQIRALRRKNFFILRCERNERQVYA